MCRLLRLVHRRLMAGRHPAQPPHHCTERNNAPIKGQCTNVISVIRHKRARQLKHAFVGEILTKYCCHSLTCYSVKAIIVPHPIIWSWYTGRLLHLVQQGGDWAGPQPAQSPPRCTKCNGNSPPINASVSSYYYIGPLLCGFNVPNKGLNYPRILISDLYVDKKEWRTEKKNSDSSCTCHVQAVRFCSEPSAASTVTTLALLFSNGR